MIPWPSHFSRERNSSIIFNSKVNIWYFSSLMRLRNTRTCSKFGSFYSPMPSALHCGFWPVLGFSSQFFSRAGAIRHRRMSCDFFFVTHAGSCGQFSWVPANYFFEGSFDAPSGRVCLIFWLSVRRYCQLSPNYCRVILVEGTIFFRFFFFARLIDVW